MDKIPKPRIKEINKLVREQINPLPSIIGILKDAGLEFLYILKHVWLCVWTLFCLLTLPLWWLPALLLYRAVLKNQYQIKRDIIESK